MPLALTETKYLKLLDKNLLTKTEVEPGVVHQAVLTEFWEFPTSDELPRRIWSWEFCTSNQVLPQSLRSSVEPELTLNIAASEGKEWNGESHAAVKEMMKYVSLVSTFRDKLTKCLKQKQDAFEAVYDVLDMLSCAK